MPSLFLPATIAKKLLPDYQLPLSFKRYQLHGADGSQQVTDRLTVYVQTLTVNGFSFGYLILQVRQLSTLQFTSTDQSGILHYLLTGGMHIHRFRRTPMLLYGSQQYGLAYHPKGTQLTFQFEQGEYHYFQVAFSLNLLQQMLRSFPLPSLYPFPVFPVFTSFLPINKRVNELIELLLMQAYRAVPDVLQMNNYALQLTARFIYDYKVQEKRQNWVQKKEIQLAELEAYIIDHLDTDNRALLSLPVLAKKTGTTPYYFKKLFKQQYGYSHAVFIHKKRMERAMQLIAGSSLPAGDIYQQVGYEDFSSFTRAFTTYYGHPPSYYRST